MRKNLNNEDLDQDLQEALKEIANDFEREDSWVRKQQVKLWKKNEEFWHGVQFIFWSEARQDWIAPTETRWFQQEEGREETEGPFYDFVINIYKAHGESIIAALSTQVPTIHFPPDDAESTEDLETSRTYSKIADLIQKHNRAKMILLGALFKLFNQGLVFAYHPSRVDKSFGTHMLPKYGTKQVQLCPNCGEESEREESEHPGESLEEEIAEGQEGRTEGGEESSAISPSICPTCGDLMQPSMKSIIEGFEEIPKSRVLIDVYGPLHVKIPYYVRSPKEVDRLLLSVDQGKALLKHLYPHVADKIDADFTEIGQYERVARTPSAYSSYSRIDENRNLSTLRRFWFLPHVFELLGPNREDQKEKLQKLFPDGCYVAFIGSTYVESRNENLHEYWTIGQAGLSTYIHSDPLGQTLIPVQEARNALFNLTMDTIEHGIPSGFADSEVLDFDVYSRHEAAPGMIYPVAPKPGHALGESFYESNRATLSKEIPLFGRQLDQDAQFVTGSFPSIYGGPSEGKSRTFSEYNASRQMALQRLSIAWTYVTDWWSRLMEKCVKLYIKNLLEDERFVTRENGSYVNVWVRRAALSGRVGSVEPEASDQFPISSGQKRDLLLQLMQLNNEFINAALFDTENRKLISEAMSFPDLYIPGEDQRIKQVKEIRLMLRGIPVQPDPAVDDDEVHISTSKRWLASLEGLDTKETNPEGYALNVQHLQMHEQIVAQKTQQQFEESAPGQPPEGVE